MKLTEAQKKRLHVLTKEWPLKKVRTFIKAIENRGYGSKAYYKCDIGQIRDEILDNLATMIKYSENETLEVQCKNILSMFEKLGLLKPIPTGSLPTENK
jgi:hypothetical protein